MSDNTFFCNLTRDEVIQILMKQRKAFADHNGITEDEATNWFRKAEKTEGFQEYAKTEFNQLRLQNFTAQIAQNLINREESHLSEAKTPPTSPQEKTRRHSI